MGKSKFRFERTIDSKCVSDKAESYMGSVETKFRDQPVRRSMGVDRTELPPCNKVLRPPRNEFWDSPIMILEYFLDRPGWNWLETALYIIRVLEFAAELRLCATNRIARMEKGV